jgi:radical SAM-linked protein
MSPFRYRILFAKTEAMRFTGHLDLHRAWERLVRRARLPLVYSSGYHPHPRIQIGAALPLGVTGEYELVDIGLEEEKPAEELARDLAAHAPPGLMIRGAAPLNPGSPGLEELIAAGDYFINLLEGKWPPDLAQRIAAMLASSSLPRERRGKPYDLRPRILELGLEKDALRMRLRLEQDATGRPDETLAALGLEDLPVLIRRAHLLLKTSQGGFRGTDEPDIAGLWKQTPMEKTAQ